LAQVPVVSGRNGGATSVDWTAGDRSRCTERASCVMPLDARPVDPRDQVWEVNEPEYRVYFWDAEGRSDEWELGGCDVQEVVKWAQDSAAGRVFVVYAVAAGSEAPSPLRLLGFDPARS
jgi:hypothetical protein